MTRLLTHLFLIAFFASACGPVEYEKKGDGKAKPKGPQKPATHQELEDFQRILTSIGRVEVVARLAQGDDIKSADPMAKMMARAMVGLCQIEYKPLTVSNDRGVLKIAGDKCPMAADWQVNYKLRDLISYVSEGSFKIKDQTMGQQNDVLNMNYRFLHSFREASNPVRKSMRLESSGAIRMQSLSYGDIDIEVLTKIVEGTMDDVPTKEGEKIITLSSARLRIQMIAEYNVFGKQDNSHYTLNGEKISVESFETYLALLGLLKDAG